MKRSTLNNWIKAFFWGAVITGALLISNYCNADGLTEVVFTAQGNFVMTFDGMVCEGTIDGTIAGCHETISLPIPEGLR